MSKKGYVAGKIPYFGIPTTVLPTHKSYEWNKMQEEELLNYLCVRPVPGGVTGGSLVCHGPTLEYVREFGAGAEEILKRLGIEFTVREDEDLPEEGGPYWWRTITVVHPESVESSSIVVQ